MVTPEKGCRRRKPEGEERVLGSPNIKAAGQGNRKGRGNSKRNRRMEQEEDSNRQQHFKKRGYTSGVRNRSEAQ